MKSDESLVPLRTTRELSSVEKKLYLKHKDNQRGNEKLKTTKDKKGPHGKYSH